MLLYKHQNSKEQNMDLTSQEISLVTRKVNSNDWQFELHEVCEELLEYSLVRYLWQMGLLKVDVLGIQFLVDGKKKPASIIKKTIVVDIKNYAAG